MDFFIERDFVLSHLNFVSSERVDPLLKYLSGFFSDYNSLICYLLLQLICAGIGAFLLFSQFCNDKRSSLYKTIIFLIATISVLAIHPVALRLHWFPILQLAFLLSFKKKLLGYIILLPSLFIWIISAGSLSIFGLLLAVFFSFFIVSSFEKDIQWQSLFIFLITSLSLVFAYITLPYYVFDYPPGARLVPLSGLAPLPNPFFGPYPQVKTIVEPVYRDELFNKGILSLFCFSVVLFFSFFDSRKNNFIKGVCIAACSVFFIVGELILKGASAELGLFASFSRMIPGLALSALPWLCFSIFFLLFLLMVDLSKKACFSSIALISVFLGASICINPAQYSFTNEAHAFVFAKQEQEIESIISRFIVKYWGDWVLDSEQIEKRKYDSLVLLRSGVDYSAEFDANISKEMAWKVGDGNPRTRWATSRPQSKGDTFYVTFSEEEEFVQVVLSIQKTLSDFPRGLKISSIVEGEKEKIIFEKETWVGPVKWNSSKNPYFGAQSEVVIDFGKSVKAKKLKITQTSSDTTFDWSIGEFKLFAFSK